MVTYSRERRRIAVLQAIGRHLGLAIQAQRPVERDILDAGVVARVPGDERRALHAVRSCDTRRSHEREERRGERRKRPSETYAGATQSPAIGFAPVFTYDSPESALTAPAPR